MTTDIASGLRLALYPLYYIDQVSTFDGLTESQAKCLPSDRRVLLEALEWICANPGADFQHVLPNLHHSNEDILAYARVLLHQLNASGSTPSSPHASSPP